jgi:hypothetical protein
MSKQINKVSRKDCMEAIEFLFIQVDRYMPFINIITVDTRLEGNVAHLRVEYVIPSLSVSDSLELDVKGQL